MRTLANAPLVLLLILCALAAFVVPFWYWDGGLIEIEGTQFIRQYLDGRSGLLRIIFDPHANDLGTFQARELSFLFDYLDARTFGARVALDRVSFVPPSALLSGLLTIVLCLLSIRRQPRLVQLTLSCAVLVYLTNYVNVVTMGMHYRSTKVLLAPVLMGTALYVATLFGVNRRWAPPVVFVLFSVMALLDRQGFFYAVLGLGVLIVLAVTTSSRWHVALAGAGAVIFLLFYNAVLGPMLVERINGYVPNAEYQRLPIGNLLTDPAIVVRGSWLLIQAGAALFGGLSVPWFAGVAALIVGAWIVFRPFRVSRTILVLAGMLVVGEIALASLMIVRHPPVYDYYDHRVWYYPLPFQAMLVALLIIYLSKVAGGWGKRQSAVALILLAAMVVSNVVHWADYRRAQLGSRWFPVVYAQTTALKESLTDGRPRPSLSPEYLALYEVCVRLSPALRERAARVQRGSPEAR
jgi:hypothetical protein